jgi:hypothetical protein
MSVMTGAAKVPAVKKAAAKAPSASKTGGAKKASPPAPAKKTAPARKGTAAPAGKATAPAPSRSQRARTKAAGAGKDFLGEGVKLGKAHRVVAAEFVLCVVLVGIGPILIRKPKNGHLYQANDFVRLSALSLLFFVLALMSNTPRSARLAAAFGGLVTLGVVYNASAPLAAVGGVFVNSTKTKGAVATAAEGTETYDTATYTPGLDTGPVQLTGGSSGAVSA